ncbi:MAG: CheW domain-containing protein [Desulfobacteraceae bacterium]|nr:CheW domain-containing protein [Desulfobacteraceae bacterium]
MKQTQNKKNQVKAQVLIFPAQLPEIEGTRIHYLFSVRQIVDVLRHADVQPVPFSPQYAEGVTEWRGRILPVICLETCLGIGLARETMPLRTIVARSVYRQKHDAQPQNVYAIVKVGAAVRQLELPVQCEPLDPPPWIANTSYLSGVYGSDKNLYLISDLVKILKPANVS